MKCRKTKKFLIEYLYDQPDDKRREFLVNHFQNCTDCQQAEAGFKATLKLVEEKEKLQLNEESWPDFQSKLERKLAQETIRPEHTGKAGVLIPKLKEIGRRLKDGMFFGGFEPSAQPVWVKSLSVIVFVLVVVGAGLYLFPNFIPDKAKPQVLVSSSKTSVELDDYALVAEMLEQEEDLEAMQELLGQMAEDEEIDMLLQIEAG